MWKPPVNPDPQKIFRSVKSDIEKRSFDNALSKLIWFHHNALKFCPSLYGVRLSYALFSFQKLASQYKKAEIALNEIRNKTIRKVLRNKIIRHPFHDLCSINETIGIQKHSVEIFKKVHAKNPDQAKTIYSLVDELLIKNKEFELCQEYFDPNFEFKRAVSAFQVYEKMKRKSEKMDFLKSINKFRKEHFIKDISKIIALQVVLKRKKAAIRLRKDALAIYDVAKSKKSFDKALNGTFPF